MKIMIRIATLMAAAAVSVAAMAQTDFNKTVAEGYFLGNDADGNLTFAVSGKADYDMPAPSTSGLAALNEALLTSAGIKTDASGIVFNYLPGDGAQSVDAAAFASAVASGNPKTAYHVDTRINKVAETPHYISMRAASNTKSLTPDGYDISTVEYVNYNKDTDAVIDYFDVFNASAERRLREMMYPVAAKKYALTLESSDDMEIVPNFALTPEGVTFCFPESSIAPASAGCPEITLTWQQLRSGHTLADGIDALLGQ